MALIIALYVVLAVAPPAYTHARAAGLLLRFADETAHTGIASIGMHDVDEESATIDTPQGPTRARYYSPRGMHGVPGMIVCHGVHHLGIDEPRMKKFARAIASAGVVVLTPELKELADYRIDPRTIGTIGRAAIELKKRVHRSGVGVLGLSFAGGLSILAAADPEYAPAIDFVVSVGGHDDLERVAHFFVSDEVHNPDGTVEHMTAHGYGALVLISMYVDSFFDNRDVPIARDALRAVLWENFDEGHALAKKLSPAGQEKIQRMFDHKLDLLRPEIEAVIERHRAEMARVSPHDNITGLRAHLFLLHGEGDNVIPPSETRWLAHDAPEGVVVQALVSRAIAHVNLEGKPTTKERYEIVHMLAGVIDAAEAEAPREREPEPLHY